MTEKSSKSLFNGIAPVYNLFYHFQRRSFRRIIKDAKNRVDFKQYKTVLDIGCGTGALCSALYEQGLQVTGVDPAQKMLALARSRPENSGIRFLEGDASKPLPFSDKAFDLCIASYVAHGLPPEQRRLLYAQMSRLARDLVIIYDYNSNRSWLTTAIEWLERGDYFRFIKKVPEEMEDCISGMKACFSQVSVYQVGRRAAWYLCTPST